MAVSDTSLWRCWKKVPLFQAAREYIDPSSLRLSVCGSVEAESGAGVSYYSRVRTSLSEDERVAHSVGVDAL
jgi:hypothetical protein